MYTNTLFSKQIAFAEKHKLEIIDIINKECLMEIIKIRPSDFREDTKESTDLVIEVKGGKIATRIRNYTKEHYRDLTIRTKVSINPETEIDKLRKGWCDWYFYVWLNDKEKVTSWILVDLKEIREIGMLDVAYWVLRGWKEEHTKKEMFIPMDILHLYNTRCIVKYQSDEWFPFS